MKTESKLQSLQDMEAYKIYWQQVYQCKLRLSTVVVIDLNLEIIVDSNQTLLAYRHDLPDDMMHMVINTGHWHIFNEEKISSEVLVEVMILLGELRLEICQN